MVLHLLGNFKTTVSVLERGHWNQWGWDGPLRGTAGNRLLPHHRQDTNVTWGCGQGEVPATRFPLKVPHPHRWQWRRLPSTCSRSHSRAQGAQPLKGQAPGEETVAGAGVGRKGPICQLGLLDPGLGCSSAPTLGRGSCEGLFRKQLASPHGLLPGAPGTPTWAQLTADQGNAATSGAAPTPLATPRWTPGHPLPSEKHHSHPHSALPRLHHPLHPSQEFHSQTDTHTRTCKTQGYVGAPGRVS